MKRRFSKNDINSDIDEIGTFEWTLQWQHVLVAMVSVKS